MSINTDIFFWLFKSDAKTGDTTPLNTLFIYVNLIVTYNKFTLIITSSSAKVSMLAAWCKITIIVKIQLRSLIVITCLIFEFVNTYTFLFLIKPTCSLNSTQSNSFLTQNTRKVNDIIMSANIHLNFCPVCCTALGRGGVKAKPWMCLIIFFCYLV